MRRAEELPEERRKNTQQRQRTEQEADYGFKDRQQKEQRHSDALPEEVQDTPAKIGGNAWTAVCVSEANAGGS